MKSRKRYAKTFYTKRSLPQPNAEYWPEVTDDLRDLLQRPANIPFVLLGGGQHLRAMAIGERTFDVVRTDNLNRILSVDHESKLLRAECGLKWGDLHESALQEGLSLERSRLYPLTASIGGLLSRYEACHKELWDGDLKTSLVSITAISPDNSYSYLPAPRKASGPDMRWIFVGAEGLVGAILDATLLLWKPSEGRLWIWQDEELANLLNIWRRFVDAGVRVSWAVIRNNQLVVAAHGVESVLREADRLVKTLGGEIAGATKDVAQMRREFESQHPDQRENSSASRTLRVTTSLQHLESVHAPLVESAEQLEIWDLTRHRATLFCRFKKYTAAEISETQVLDQGAVVGEKLIRWPAWAQTLKHELDPQRTLAIGP